MYKWFTLAGFVMLTGCGGSSSSGDVDSADGQSASALVGTWISNCSLFEDDGSYYIDTWTFTETTYTTDSEYFHDHLCSSPNGLTDSYLGEYTEGAQEIATDGVEVTRIVMSFWSPSWPSHVEPQSLEFIYRVTGADLQLGDYVAGESPSLDPDYTLVRQ